MPHGSAHARGTPARYACSIMQQAPPPRRKHTLTWALAWFALIELGALALVITLRTNACSAIGFAPNGGAALRLGGGGGGTNTPGGGSDSPPITAPQASAPVALPPTATPSNAAANPGDVKTAGDTDQVPDPNCVAKAAADVLNTNPAPSASASCAPMSPPPALKNAEQQIQSGNVSTPPR